MKTTVVCFFLRQSLVLSRPQNNAGSFSKVSNFNPKTQTFTSGTNTQLSQTFSSSQNSFFQSLDAELDGLVPDNVLGATGFDDRANTGFDQDVFLDPSVLLGGSFDVFSSATGACDSFCQNAKRLEDQSLDQFQKDLKNFEAQFTNANSNTNFIQNRRGAGQDVNSPTTFNQFRPNSFSNPQPVAPRSKQPTFTKLKVTPFTILNRPSTTTRTSLTRPTSRQTSSTTESSKIRTMKSPASSTTEEEENKNSNGVSITVETTTEKILEIKFTFNGKRIGSSKSTTKRSAEKKEELPISTFFNEDDENKEEKKNKNKYNNNTSDFPVFDAVPK